MQGSLSQLMVNSPSMVIETESGDNVTLGIGAPGKEMLAIDDCVSSKTKTSMTGNDRISIVATVELRANCK